MDSYLHHLMEGHILPRPTDPWRAVPSFLFSDARHSPTSAKLFSRLPSSPPQTTLRKFPCEIRDMIYKLVLPDSWDGTTHSFIAALRPDHSLYEEALQVFYKTNTFSFTKQNDWLKRFLWKNRSGSWVLDSSIKHMCKTLQSVYVRVPLQDFGPIFGGLSITPSFDRCALILSLAKNVTHLHISVVPNTSHINPQWFSLISHLMQFSSRLVKLSVTWQQETIEMDDCEWLSPLITKLSRDLRISARIERVQTGGDCTWVWSADPGDTVRYTQHASLLSAKWRWLESLDIHHFFDDHE